MILINITIGKIKQGALVAVLLKQEDVPWELPRNVPFHAKGYITEMAKVKGGEQRYKVSVYPSRTFMVNRSQIKPLPFNDPSSEIALRNMWDAYIKMNLRQYLKYVWKKITTRLEIIKREHL